MKKGLSVLLIAAALFGFYGGATSLNDVLASKDYWEEVGEKSTADMNKLEDGLNQLKDNKQAYLDGKEELAEGEEVKPAEDEEEKYTLIDAFRLLIRNKYYLMICASYILMQIYSATLNMGIYFMTYVLKNANLLGVFSWAINIPMIIGLLFTPALVAKFGGMYKLNLTGYTLGTIGRLGVVIAGYLGSVPLMLFFTAVAAIGMSPLQGDMNALIATCSEYTYLTSGKRVDGTMYSCTSLGTKLGGGIGTALAGWLLALSGYVGGAAEQTTSCMNMLHVMYLWMPMIFNLLITLILTRLNVEKANEELRKHRG